MSAAAVTSSPAACSGDEVGRGAEHGPVLREPRQLGRARDAEVGDLEDVVFADEEIRGLHVAVDEPGVVRVLQPGARLERERHRLRVAPAFRARASVSPGTYSMTM